RPFDDRAPGPQRRGMAIRPIAGTPELRDGQASLERARAAEGGRERSQKRRKWWRGLWGPGVTRSKSPALAGWGGRGSRLLIKKEADAIFDARNHHGNGSGLEPGQSLLAAAGHQEDGVVVGTVRLVDTGLQPMDHLPVAELMRGLGE